MPSTLGYPIRKLLLLWMFLLSAVAFLDRTNISIAGGFIRDELGLDYIQLGLDIQRIPDRVCSVPGYWRLVGISFRTTTGSRGRCCLVGCVHSTHYGR